ncbi:MAG: Efflux ABC transporter, ATP-binding protein [Ktedonobacterales bacterium]|jgi:ABC-2 type transport system ATP-binding protein|nr:MAG: Efflux ABC transporter, ATP-binding protein [Ktedonobacterales bacterium]
MSVVVEELTRTFGAIEAVKGISFAVEKGEVFGFLGPNGAGKSTTIKMLCTLLKPTSGRALVNGYDVVQMPTDVRRSIGIVFQDPTLDDYLSAEQNLRYHCMLYHTPPATRPTRIDSLLRLVGLEDRRKDLVKTFSGGMKRRLEVARGLLHEPQTLFLDEPTVGLDPQTRRSVWEYVMRLRQSTGLTIFMTTHYLEEAEYCDRIAIMDHGRVVALDTPDALKRQVGRESVHLVVAPEDVARAALVIGEDRRVTHGEGGELQVECAEGASGQALAAQLLRQLTLSDIAVQAVSVHAPSLDDVFMRLTGRAIRDETAGAKERLEARLRGRGRLRRRS